MGFSKLSSALGLMCTGPYRTRMGLLIFMLAVCGCQADSPAVVSGFVPQRIVSLSPGLTETLFALGVGDRVVGVTRFCGYPPEVSSKTRVGGFLDPNWEAIVALEPDLVVLMESHADVEARLTGLGITSVRVDQHDVESALDSFVLLARACGVSDSGSELRHSVESRLAEVERAISGAARPEVMVVIGRNAGSGDVHSVWAAAGETFFDDVVALAGGTNILAEKGLGRHPEISREGLIDLAPEVILDIIPDLEERGLTPDVVLADWSNLIAVQAAKEHRVVVLSQPYMATPGPRLAEVVEVVARALHPELVW